MTIFGFKPFDFSSRVAIEIRLFIVLLSFIGILAIVFYDTFALLPEWSKLTVALIGVITYYISEGKTEGYTWVADHHCQNPIYNIKRMYHNKVIGTMMANKFYVEWKINNLLYHRWRGGEAIGICLFTLSLYFQRPDNYINLIIFYAEVLIAFPLYHRGLKNKFQLVGD
jgi:hypothetical protein